MKLRLIDLPDMHPCLLWDDIIAATVAVLDERGFSAPFRFSMDVQDLPGYDNVVIDFQILKSGVTSGQKDENREFCTISRERHVGDC